MKNIVRWFEIHCPREVLNQLKLNKVYFKCCQLCSALDFMCCWPCIHLLVCATVYSKLICISLLALTVGLIKFGCLSFQTWSISDLWPQASQLQKSELFQTFVVRTKCSPYSFVLAELNWLLARWFVFLSFSHLLLTISMSFPFLSIFHQTCKLQGSSNPLRASWLSLNVNTWLTFCSLGPKI